MVYINLVGVLEMPVPKRKHSRARRDSRSANKGIKPKAVASCQTCQEPIATHAACSSCGYYKGVKVLKTKSDRLHGRVQTRQTQELKHRAKNAITEPDQDKNTEK